MREHGRLVEKDRFFSEVWDDVVVSDAALTQGIEDIRRQLGDDASNPRFIQTVPRYGYRSIEALDVGQRDAVAPLSEGDADSQVGSDDSPPGDGAPLRLQDAALWGGAGALGGGFAGALVNYVVRDPAESIEALLDWESPGGYELEDDDSTFDDQTRRGTVVMVSRPGWEKRRDRRRAERAAAVAEAKERRRARLKEEEDAEEEGY